MSIREEFENRERGFIAPYGTLSTDTRGREHPEPLCDIRTAFHVDRERILYSNAFRRLKHKTQVFLSPMGEQYRTRLTHTLEVAQIARTIARAMRLNEDLTEAIALGHDLGHTPFGHSGETTLKEIYSSDFAHNEQSLRVVDCLERDGIGLNLTHEVRDGILKHSKGYGKVLPDRPEELPCTVEGQVVRIADIMAYLNHDLDDAIRSGVIRAEQVPEVCVRRIGRNHSERASNMIQDLIRCTRIQADQVQLQMSDAMYGAMTLLRRFLYQNVYRSYKVHKEFVKAKKILSELYYYFIGEPERMERELVLMEMHGCSQNGQPRDRVVCDLVASLTDRHALDLYTAIFFPEPLV